MTKGQRIKKRREELLISQTELARRVGITKHTLYKYENDIITNIPSDNLERIAKALGVSPSYIFGWQEPATDDSPWATELYEKYKSAPPEVRAAVELLLKSAQQDP